MQNPDKRPDRFLLDIIKFKYKNFEHPLPINKNKFRNIKLQQNFKTKMKGIFHQKIKLKIIQISTLIIVLLFQNSHHRLSLKISVC